MLDPADCGPATIAMSQDVQERHLIILKYFRRENSRGKKSSP